MLGGRAGQRATRKAIGVWLIAGLCGVTLLGVAPSEDRGGRCTGELDGKVLRGAITIRTVAMPEIEHVVGNFASRQLRVELEAYLQKGSGSGTLRYMGAPPHITNVDVELRRGGFILRTHAGSKSLFSCNGW
jgi:hypothetical protein